MKLLRTKLLITSNTSEQLLFFHFPPNFCPKGFPVMFCVTLIVLEFLPSSACVCMLTLMDMLLAQTFSQWAYSFDRIDVQLSFCNCLASHSVSSGVPQWNNSCREQKCSLGNLDWCMWTTSMTFRAGLVSFIWFCRVIQINLDVDKICDCYIDQFYCFSF